MLQKYQLFWNYYVDMILIITRKYKIRFELKIEIMKLNVHFDPSLEDMYTTACIETMIAKYYRWLRLNENIIADYYTYHVAYLNEVVTS